VLSLSATPIPRTLYMSLVGLRDVSQIMTPPEGRQPIQTLLQPYDPMTVRQAIMFELERGGKTYYIHDRIGSMGMRAKTLSQLVPEARIGVAHGQMAADDLEPSCSASRRARSTCCWRPRSSSRASTSAAPTPC
jgi:transcription-repair coupling factor (superfamily II helicase)